MFDRQDVSQLMEQKSDFTSHLMKRKATLEYLFFCFCSVLG